MSGAAGGHIRLYPEHSCRKIEDKNGVRDYRQLTTPYSSCVFRLVLHGALKCFQITKQDKVASK